MIIDNHIQNLIDKELLRVNAERDAKHEPSGRLSASTLWMPVLFQVYKTIGVPKKPMEAYVLGKFKRGDDVEDWFVEQMQKNGLLLDQQVRVMYRECVGFVDALVDSNKMLFKQGPMPHEIKSVTNIKLKRIAKDGEVDYHYQMQACFYAMALGLKYYAVDVVSAEDLRTNVYIFETAKLAGEVDAAITKYENAMKDWKEKKILPKFEPNPKVPWTAKLEYAPFTPDWVESDTETIMKKLEALKLV
jgi:hypothetical protein